MYKYSTIISSVCDTYDVLLLSLLLYYCCVFVLFLCKCRFCNLFVVFGINHRLNSVQLDRPLDSNGEPMLLKLKVSYLLAIYVFSPFL